MQKSLIVTGVVLVVAVVALVAQQAVQEQQRDATNHKACLAAASDSPTTKPASPYVNVKCPIMQGDIDPAKVTDATTRVFNGQKVAFCCAGCPEKWDKLSDKEKQAKLDAVKAPAATTEPADKAARCPCCQ
jgi:hypothetical protein